MINGLILAAVTTGNAGQMYTNDFDVIFVDSLLACIPALLGLMICIALAGAYHCPRFLWSVWGLLVACTAGAIFGKVNGFYLGCTIAAGVVYILLRWSRTRSWLFGNFWRGLITVVVIVGFFGLVWLI